MFQFQMRSELGAILECFVAAVYTLPPFAMSLHFMLEPFMPRFIGAICDFAVFEGTHLSRMSI